LSRLLRGDLDTIVLKALQAEPDRRYPTVQAFSEDIERYLRQQPISARKDAGMYRAGKFLQRHAIGVGLGALVVAALLTTTTLSIYQARRAENETRRAQIEARRALATKEFLFNLFEVSDSGMPRDQMPTTQTLLQDGAKRIRDEFGDTPDVKFDLLLMLGQVQRHLGQYASAEPLLKEALAIADANFAPGSIPRLQAHTQWAQVLNEQSRIAQSARELGAAIAMYQHAGAADSDALIEALTVLGAVYSNLEQFDRSIATSRQALDMARRLHGERHPVVQKALGNLGQMLMRAGRLKEAESAARANVFLSGELYGKHNAKYANSLTVLADALSQQNKDAESERLARQALAIEESVYDRPNAALIDTLSALTDSLYDQDKFDETDATLQRWLAAQTQLTGPDDPSLTPILFNLGTIAKRRHQYAQAERAMRQALAIFGKRPGSAPSTQESDTWRSLAEILVAQQRPLEAIAAVQEALTIDRNAHGSDDQRVGMDTMELARADMKLGHLPSALEQVDEALGILGKSSRTENRDLNDDLNDARVLKATVLNRLARTQEAKDLLLPMIPRLRQAGSENADHDRLSRTLAELGRAQSGSGETRDALASWDEALALQLAIQPPDTEAITELQGLIAQARKAPRNTK